MNSCLTCEWAEWAMTNHATPRIALTKYGRCRYPMERVALPSAFSLHSAGAPTADALRNSLAVIWPDNPHTNCRVWEKK